MVLVTCFIVVMRYFFDAGWIWLQETVTWMHAALFMLGAAYTLSCDEHVRVDVFYRGMKPSTRRIVDIGGVIFFLWPLCGYLAVTGFDYAAASWTIEEASRESGGLPYPFVPLMKTLLPATAVLLALQGLAIVLANLVRRPGESG